MTTTSSGAADALISVRSLNKFYGDFHVLKDVTLEVEKGKKVVICGPSGSGKSTLIRCVNGLERYLQGTITVDGTPLGPTGKGVDIVRRKVGMVFQHFNLFPHLTVLQNLTIAPIKINKVPRAEAEERAMHFLKRVHIDAQASKFPSQLSGGQQQRVAIARALCLNPTAMLFDEPTSALDPEMIGEVLDVITELAEEGMTMICVTHEMGFARRVADEVVFMADGMIIERRTPEEFFTNPKTSRARSFLEKIIR